MYTKVYRIHNLIILLFQVLLVVPSSSQYLNIIPSNFSGVCPDNRNDTCLILAELASNISRLDQANITLNFLPGDHVLAQRVVVNDAINLVLTGHVCNVSKCATKIKCKGNSGFDFENLNSINITGLEFSGCGGKEINGGALRVSNVTFLSIFNCHFNGNGVSGVKALGGAVYIDTALDVLIQSSSFINNSAQCNNNAHQMCDSGLSVGGAIVISASKHSVLINLCHFEQNNAYTSAGAIASINTTLVVVHSTFVYNQVQSETIGFGGAIYADHSNLTILNNQYVSNTAVIEGGAISVSKSLLYISDSHFANNTAHTAGGSIAIGGESNLTSSGTNFTNNNAAQFGGAVYIFQSSLAETAGYYSNNIAQNGGAVYIEEGGMSSSGSYYINNTGNFGGAVFILNSALSSNSSHHMENSATNGGAIYVDRGNLSASNDNYTYNQAVIKGGSLFFTYGSVFTSNCDFENNTAKGGGAIYVEQGTASTSGTRFIGNMAEYEGGAIFISESALSSASNIFKSNTASKNGGAIRIYNSSLLNTNSYYVGNSANAGGAMCADEGNIVTNNSWYETNKAGLYGGAIMSYRSSTDNKSELELHIHGSNFLRNEANKGGSIVAFLIDNASVSESNFESNHARNGGALYVEESLSFCTCNTFTNNTAENGGAVFVNKTIVTMTLNHYSNNKAVQLGGAIRVIKGSISSSDSHYTKNIAAFGGAIYIDRSSVVSTSHDTYTFNSVQSFGGAIGGNTSSVSCTNNTYSNNSGQVGGAMYIEYSNISSVASYYEMNTATVLGGAISTLNAIFSTIDSYFMDNRATKSGGAIYVETGNVSISGGYFTANQAQYGGVIQVRDGSVHTIYCFYSNNSASRSGGVMYVDTSSINSVESHYMSNNAPQGGVFTILQSSLRTSKSYYTNNIALQGGAIFFVCSEQSPACNIVSVGSYYMSNSAQSGGAIASDTSNVNATDDYYSYNYANVGGAMSLQGTITISGTSFFNNNATTGGAISVSNSLLSISYSQFTNNTGIGGGALSCDTTSITMLYSNCTNNQAQQGGAIATNGISVTCSNCFFVSNKAFLTGGVMTVESGDFTSIDCHFKNNQARYQGGALQIEQGNVFSINSSYSSNEAGILKGGGAIYVDKGSVTTTGSTYTGNLGGAIFINNEGSVFSSDSCYVNNTSGYYGGVMFVSKGNVYSNRNLYINNSAVQGGSIYANEGNVSCVDSSFTLNKADNGGAIFGWINTVVSSLRCQYGHNTATDSGGAICSVSGAITSSNTTYTNNYSNHLGGALFVFGGNISNANSHFDNNEAHRAGGAICALVSNIYSDTSYYESSHAEEYGGAIYTDSCMNSDSLLLSQPGADDKLLLARVSSICTEKKYLERPGFVNVQMELSGRNVFTNNTCGLVGGAFISIQVEVFFSGRVSAATVVSNNAATYGGGMALAGSTLTIHSPVEIQDNNATLSGGGTFSYQSVIRLSSLERTSISGNSASQNGGGVFAIRSYIEIICGVMCFENNVASKGAAVSLEQNSKIHLLKERQESVGEYFRKLEFINNYASYGGAVYILDSSENIRACERAVQEDDIVQSSQECFIQTLLLNTTMSNNNTRKNYINVFLFNNTANVSGGDIYGGLLDRCMMNQSAELVTQFPEYQQSTGFDYIRATAQFAGLVDYDNLTSNYHPDKLIKAITSPSVEDLISSEPVEVCFCLENVHNCSYDHPSVFTKKGQLFQLNVVAVDQVGNPINATVISSFVSSNGDLNVDQARQKTTTHCTELEYNVYPRDDSSSFDIELYAEGPCRDHGISKRIVNVTFLPCTCPIGFQPVETETLCTCDCDPILRPYIVNCSYINDTVLRDSNAWIDYVNTTTEAGYLLYHNCPFDYCVDEPVNINLNIPTGADIQCAFNRSGKLCGACKSNLSLMVGSSRCKECSNSFISLIVPFALAGIALVALILILNITVATGTIHGLIFYANILVASRSIFIPFDTPSILIIFISWINLDLGIETCFYNGMNSYAKVLLQLAFPTYIILITISIIIISEYSIRFSTLIGKKDPVATLCTLILLSYAKLIRTIIASLQFTYLNNPDGSSEIVWLYDANVPYFSPSHIPRFVIAFIIIILGSVYTVLIFFGQWIPRCGNRSFLRCFNNPKYNAFIVKYHAPFNPKHRYWVGLLFITRILHYIVSAFVTDSAMLLSVGCAVLGLLLFKLWNFNSSIYKHHLLDALETSFFVNLGIFTYTAYYVRESEGNKIALSSISLGLSFITFLGILIYHFYDFILKKTPFWSAIVRLRKQLAQVSIRNNKYERVPLEEDKESVDDNSEQDEQMIEMQPPYTDDNDTDPIDLPHVYDPPLIVPAVRYDQLREPDLDIIDPITTDDYKQLNQPPAPRPQQVPTSTVIDFVRPRHNVDRLDQP